MIASVYDPTKMTRRVPTRHVAEGEGGAERAQQQCRMCLVLRMRGGLVLVGEGAPFGQLLLGGQELAVTVRTPFDSEVNTTSIHVALKGLDLSYAGTPLLSLADAHFSMFSCSLPTRHSPDIFTCVHDYCTRRENSSHHPKRILFIVSKHFFINISGYHTYVRYVL